jgi:hypothetical protein
MLPGGPEGCVVEDEDVGELVWVGGRVFIEKWVGG